MPNGYISSIGALPRKKAATCNISESTASDICGTAKYGL
jgi:hypothetical protein